MTTLISKSSPSAPVTSGLLIRIVVPEAGDRTVPLPVGKCTVGSSERCQIQLVDSQVRPLHCLLVHEKGQVLVTRWAPGVLLNGLEFETAEFHPGDTLEMGDVHLVLLAEPQLSHKPKSRSDFPALPSTASKATGLPAEAPAHSALFVQPSPTATAFPAAPPSECLLHDAAPESRAGDSSVGFPKSTQPRHSPIFQDQSPTPSATPPVSRQRCRDLLEALRAARAEVARFDHKVQGLEEQLNQALAERETLFAQLSQLQGESSQQENQSSEEVDRLISELTAAYAKASHAQTELAEQVQRTALLQEELQTLEAAGEQRDQVREAEELQRAKLTRSLADREQTIETLQEELESLRATIGQSDESQTQQAQALADLEGELTRVASEREQLSSELAQSLSAQQELEQSLADSDQSLAAFQVELEKFQQSSQQREEELAANSGAAFESMQEELAQRTEERDQLVSKRTEQQLREQGLEHELSTRDARVEELTQEIETLQAAMTETNQAVAQLEEQVEGRQQALEALSTERDELLDAIADQSRQIDGLQGAVQTRDHRVKELEEEHDGICQVLQSIEQGAFEQVDVCNNLQSQLEATRQERDQLVESLPGQIEYIKQLEQALAERDQQVALLGEALTKTSEEQSQLESQLAEETNVAQAQAEAYAQLQAGYQQLELAQQEQQELRQQLEQQLAQSQTAPLPVAQQAVQPIAVASAPLQESVQEAPVQQLPVQENPVQETPVQAAPEQETPVQEVPLSEAAEGAATPFWKVAEDAPEAAVSAPAVAATPDLSAAPSAPPEATSETTSEATSEATSEQPEQPFQPPSFIDQFQHLLEEDEVPESVLQQPRATPEEEAAEAAPAPTQDEADLEAYMSNMLNRMRGSAGNSTSSQAPNMPAAPAQQPAAAADKVPEEPFDWKKIKAESPNVELPTDLNAMRALANSSARGAIASHNKRLHLKKAIGLFSVCLFFVGVGIYMLWLGHMSQQYLGINFLVGGSAVLTGGVGAQRFFSVLRLAIQGVKEGKGSPASV